MSGLEALAALGIACNIMQVVSFSLETLSLCKAMYKTGSPAPSLVQNASHLEDLGKGLRASLDSAPKPLTKDQQKLHEIARGCSEAVAELKTEVARITGDPCRRGVLASVTTGFKARIRKSRIDRLEKTVQGFKGSFDTGLLLQIWYNSVSYGLA